MSPPWEARLGRAGTVFGQTVLSSPCPVPPWARPCERFPCPGCPADFPLSSLCTVFSCTGYEGSFLRHDFEPLKGFVPHPRHPRHFCLTRPPRLRAWSLNPCGPRRYFWLPTIPLHEEPHQGTYSAAKFEQSRQIYGLRLGARHCREYWAHNRSCYTRCIRPGA